MLLDIPLFQPFLDSDGGIVLANTLHTLGAIGFLGGIVLYMAWYRGLAAGTSRLATLRNAAFATYASLAVNFLGGAMRMYQSGHPGLTDIGHSSWVQVLVVKHAFLIGAGVAAVVLFERVAPRLHRLAANHAARGAAQRTQAALAGSIVIAIVLSGVLGAVSTVSDLGMGSAAMVEPADPPALDTLYYNSTGRLTTSLLVDRSASTTFFVPAGYLALNTILTWDGPQTLDLTLLDPSGESAGQPESAAGQVKILVELPAAGVWTAVVSSDLAADVAYSLSTTVSPAEGSQNVLTSTVTLSPGVFYEINTHMHEGATIHWDWSILEEQAVHFDVHTHFDDEVQYVVDETVAQHRGNLTADRTGGYSLLWENEGAAPLTLRYRVWGEFELDSIFPAT